MVRKEAYDNVGGYSVSPKLLRVEDYNLWFKMYAAGYKAYMLDKPYYRMRDDRNAKKRRKWGGRKNEYYVKKKIDCSENGFYPLSCTTEEKYQNR